MNGGAAAARGWPDRRLFLVTAGVAGLILAATAAPDLTWAHWGSDGGELITAAVTGGVPHPSGYPVYLILGRLASLLPAGTIPFRFHLLSAAGVAVAAGGVAAITRRLAAPADRTASAAAGFAAGLSLALAPLVWGQATIAEVYGLQLAFLSLGLWGLLARRSPWLAGACFGLALVSHLTSLLALPFFLATLSRRRWAQLAGGALLGASPALLLPWLAAGDSPVVWGRPDTLAGWWWLVTARLYRPAAFSLPPDRLLPRAASWLLLLGQQFTWAGPPLLAYGLWNRRGTAVWPRRVGLALTALLLLANALFYDADDAAVLLLPALLCAAPLLGPGLSRLGRLAPVLPLTLLLLNFSDLNLRHDAGVRARAMAALAQAPPAAILLTPGDQTIFALWYFHHVEGARPDLVLVDANLFAFDWYRERLARQHPELAALSADNLARFRQENGARRPIHDLSLAPPAANNLK